jgi:poly-beta-1,6-N-acetyl-D-glucosamine synthase
MILNIAVSVLLFLIIYPYAIYPIILKLMICNKHNIAAYTRIDDNLNEDMFPMVTLFIAAYNEESVIAGKIENSFSLSYPCHKFEVIVGSDGSTDSTNYIVNQYSLKYPNLKLLPFPERAGKVNVINKGISFCSGDIIVLSDANAIYNINSINNIIWHFFDETVGCVAGEKRINHPSNGTDIAQNEGIYWRLESFIKQGECKIKTVIGADGALYAIRKGLFQLLPEDTSVDDFLLSMLIVKQGYKISYEPEAYSYEETGNSLQDEFRRKVRIAAGNFFNLKYLSVFFSFNIISFLFVSHKFLRWISPFCFILLTVLLLSNLSVMIFQLLLFFLVISYVMAYYGYIAQSKNWVTVKVINILTYFYLTVLAQLVGCWKYVKGAQKAIWETVRS